MILYTVPCLPVHACILLLLTPGSSVVLHRADIADFSQDIFVYVVHVHFYDDCIFSALLVILLQRLFDHRFVPIQKFWVNGIWTLRLGGIQLANSLIYLFIRYVYAAQFIFIQVLPEIRQWLFTSNLRYTEDVCSFLVAL